MIELDTEAELQLDVRQAITSLMDAYIYYEKTHTDGADIEVLKRIRDQQVSRMEYLHDYVQTIAHPIMKNYFNEYSPDNFMFVSEEDYEQQCEKFQAYKRARALASKDTLYLTEDENETFCWRVICPHCHQKISLHYLVYQYSAYCPKCGMKSNCIEHHQRPSVVVQALRDMYGENNIHRYSPEHRREYTYHDNSLYSRWVDYLPGNEERPQP